MKQFFEEKFLTTVGTRRQDGTVQMNPAWYEYEDGYLWLNSWRGSDWLRHLERDGDVTLFIIDPQDNGRWAQIVGNLVETSDEHGPEHIDKLSLRYTGKPYTAWNSNQQRVRIQVEPTRLTTYIDR